jgi:hypothetical protein
MAVARGGGMRVREDIDTRSSAFACIAGDWRTACFKGTDPKFASRPIQKIVAHAVATSIFVYQTPHRRRLT